MSRRPGKTRAAEHRPAVRPRRFRHDDSTAVDLFSGFGGLTTGIKLAGFETIAAANHNPYKVEVHEKNHPETEHWIADLVDTEAPSYHSARDLPPAQLLAAGISCVNHTQANSAKAYEQGLTLFDLPDPDFDTRVTRSERDRATANCVLHYADQHHPLLILLECTTELASWGKALPNRPKIGDGTTYRWWLKEFVNLGYRYKILYLNSMFFGVPQSRDRWFGVFSDKRLPIPDLEHRPPSWCSSCDRIVEAVWSWKTGIPASGSVRYGKQYNYRCPACRGEVFPPMAPSINALDLTNLGTRIGDRKTPPAPATLARAERCRQRFAEFPAVLLPSAAIPPEGHPWQPMAASPMLVSTGAIMGAAGHTFERPGSDCRSRGLDEPLWAQSATNSTGLITPPIALAVDNYQGGPRSAAEPLPTQGGSETLGVLSSGILPLRKGARPVPASEPLPTVTGNQVLGLLTAGGYIKNNGDISEAAYRAHPLSDPLGTVVGTATTQGVLFGGWYKQNGGRGTETAPHPLIDPLGTLTGRDTTGLLLAEWAETLAKLKLDDCYLRMLGPHEVGRGCGFDVDFPGYGYQGAFVVWGSARDQVDGYGNAVSPAVGAWIGSRLRAILDTPEAAA
jgi:site-specific DNA-cytosine methylase